MRNGTRAWKTRRRFNYGASVSHRGTRFAVLNGVGIGHWPTNPGKVAALGLTPDGTTKPASPSQIDSMTVLLRKGLADGALGIGFASITRPEQLARRSRRCSVWRRRLA